MACGVPIVASRIEGNIAALGADHPGLFDLEDDTDYLDKTQRCLTDPDFRSRLLSYQNDQWAQQPRMQDYIQGLGRIYEGLVQASR